MIRHPALRLVGLLAAFAGTPLSVSSQTPPRPCTQPEASQFDFWIGEWEVRGGGGQIAGRNQISREIGGCVLHERYSTPRGYEGESFNIFDASRGVWHQTWVDNGGLLLSLEGGFANGAMVMQGVTATPDGDVLQRITWSRIDGGPNVRQHWETSADDGATWSTAFDGTYIPIKAPADSGEGPSE